jgi:hypothetical protein
MKNTEIPSNYDSFMNFYKPYIEQYLSSFHLTCTNKAQNERVYNLVYRSPEEHENSPSLVTDHLAVLELYLNDVRQFLTHYNNDKKPSLPVIDRKDIMFSRLSEGEVIKFLLQDNNNLSNELVLHITQALTPSSLSYILNIAKISLDKPNYENISEKMIYLLEHWKQFNNNPIQITNELEHLPLFTIPEEKIKPFLLKVFNSYKKQLPWEQFKGPMQSTALKVCQHFLSLQEDIEEFKSFFPDDYILPDSIKEPLITESENHTSFLTIQYNELKKQCPYLQTSTQCFSALHTISLLIKAKALPLRKVIEGENSNTQASFFVESNDSQPFSKELFSHILISTIQEAHNIRHHFMPNGSHISHEEMFNLNPDVNTEHANHNIHLVNFAKYSLLDFKLKEKDPGGKKLKI